MNDLDRLGGAQRLRDAPHEQVGDDAGVEIAGAQDDDVGPADGLDGPRVGVNLGVEKDPLDADGVGAPLVDGGLPLQGRAVLQDADKVGARQGHRQDRGPQTKETGSSADPLFQVARLVDQGSQDEIAEAVVAQSGVAAEAVLHEVPEEIGGSVRSGQRAQAAPDVAQRGYAELLTQPAGAAPAVHDGDDSREVGRVRTQPLHHRRAARSSPNDDDPEMRLLRGHVVMSGGAALVNGDALGQVAGPVDGAAPLPGAVVGEQLEGSGGEYGREDVLGGGELHHVVRQGPRPPGHRHRSRL